MASRVYVIRITVFTTVLAVVLFARSGVAGEVVRSSRHFVLHIEWSGDLPLDSRGAALLGRLERARLAVRDCLAGVPVLAISSRVIPVYVAGETSGFAKASGKGWYQGAAWAGGRLYLQPFDLLDRMRDLDAVLRHELAHPLVEGAIGRGAPRWLIEGLAMHIAGEKPPGYPRERLQPISISELKKIEPAFVEDRGPVATDRAYRTAYYALERILRGLESASISGDPSIPSDHSAPLAHVLPEHAPSREARAGDVPAGDMLSGNAPSVGEGGAGGARSVFSPPEGVKVPLCVSGIAATGAMRALVAELGPGRNGMAIEQVTIRGRTLEVLLEVGISE